MANIKVLAIGIRLGEVGATAGNPDPEDPQSQIFEKETVATLELSPGQAETIIGAAAAANGKLTLVLRSVADFAPSADDGLLQASNQPIRLIRFGVETNVSAVNTEEQLNEEAPIDEQVPVFVSQQLVPPGVDENTVIEDLGPDEQFSEEFDPEVPLS